MSVCPKCKRGQHSHDRWTGLGGTEAGGDAGCPNETNGRECSCQVVLPNLNSRGKPCPTCHGTGRVGVSP